MKKFLGISFIVFFIDRISKILVQNFISDKIYVIKNFFYKKKESEGTVLNSRSFASGGNDDSALIGPWRR